MKTQVATGLLAMLLSVSSPVKADSSEAPQCPPPAVVAAFLGFTDAEAAQFGTSLGQLQTTLHGVQSQITASEAQLNTLLAQPNPDPATIGGLFLQIHSLQQQAGQAIQSFQTQVASLLTDEQKQKVQAVTLASQLQPVVGAFVALNLVPAPTPLPCQPQ